MTDQVSIDDTTVYWAGRWYPCPTIAAANTLLAEIRSALDNRQQPFAPWAWCRADAGQAWVFLPDENTIAAPVGPQGDLIETMFQLAQLVPTAQIAHEMAFEHNRSMDAVLSPRF